MRPGSKPRKTGIVGPRPCGYCSVQITGTPSRCATLVSHTAGFKHQRRIDRRLKTLLQIDEQQRRNDQYAST
jgi:hypothetical protein